MPIIKTPYEFLVRFASDGTIRGSHIKFYETIVEAGEILLQREGIAQPVESANEQGFPLAEILDAALQSSLATTASLQLRIDTIAVEKISLESKLEVATGMISDLQAQLK